MDLGDLRGLERKARADAALPGVPTYLGLPGEAAGPVTVRKRAAGELHPNGRTFVYLPTVSESEVTHSMVAQLGDRLFGGDVTAFVSRARADLATLLDAAFADERARYAAALGSTGDPALALELREAARRVTELVPA